MGASIIRRIEIYSHRIQIGRHGKPIHRDQLIFVSKSKECRVLNSAITKKIPEKKCVSTLTFVGGFVICNCLKYNCLKDVIAHQHVGKQSNVSTFN